jgi:hypothetical protein
MKSEDYIGTIWENVLRRERYIMTRTANGYCLISVEGFRWMNSTPTPQEQFASYKFKRVYGKYVFKEELPDLKVDDKVLVYSDPLGEEYRRHFHSFNDDGSINVFRGGFTSWSSTTPPTTFTSWRLPDED